ncbi:MAG: UvrD-helicase domain-containing protein [Burkholderiaceae bacterium]|nr:UvrD-helicase domain-containing protein [Burkholderiaceae bacterium]
MIAGLTVNGTQVKEAIFYQTALNPQGSVVIQACAGSGKTWMLAARVVRLLLAGTSPSSILAITFTNKAATEMRNRIYGWLNEMALMEDEQLIQALRNLYVPQTHLQNAVLRARNLAIEVLSARDSLKIYTFHAWFLRLKSALPISDSAALFSTVNTAPALLEMNAWQRFLNDVAASPSLLKTYGEFVAELGLENSKRILQLFISKRTEWFCYTEQAANPVSFALSALQRLHEPVLQATPERFFREHSQSLGMLAIALGKSSGKKAQECADKLMAASMLDASPQDKIAALKKAVFTQEGAPRQLFSAQKKIDLNLIAHFKEIADALIQVSECLNAQRLMVLHHSWYTLGHALVLAYEKEKAERGQADFADLELMIARLLEDPSAGADLQARLDTQIKHLLIDEFQDTNPLQWRIVRQWLSGYEGNNERPTVFVVGDAKQSIYRFRRADPAIFPAASLYFKEYFDAALLATQRTRRNAITVNDFVNQLFSKNNGPWGEKSDPAGPFTQQITTSQEPGKVEVFERLALVERQEAPLARHPLTVPLTNDAESALLLQARAVVRRLLELMHEQKESWQWGQVLILTRARNALPEVQTALREAGIPYESSHRGGLLDAPEVADMQALAKVLATPQANLQLAQVLRCPLFGFSDTDLLSLWPLEDPIVQPRGWAALAASKQPLYQAAYQTLSRWREWAGKLPVHDVFDRIYGEHEVLKKYAAVTPLQRTDAAIGNLLRVLELALDAHAGRYPSLSRFVQTLEEFSRVESDEAPDEALPEARNSVLLTTIHSAKGLERDIVVLFDTHRQIKSKSPASEQVLIVWPPGAPRPEHFSCLFSGLNTSMREHWQMQEASRARIEEGALLYVAATRAKRHLIITGSEKRSKLKDSWWEVCAGHRPAQPWPDHASPALSHLSEHDLPKTVRFVESLSGKVKNAATESTRPFVTAKTDEEILHTLLELAGNAERKFDRDYLFQKAGQRLIVPFQKVQQVWPKALKILSSPLLKVFFSLENKAYSPWNLVSAQGELQRLDRVVYWGNTVWILAFKDIEGPPGTVQALQLTAYAKTMRFLEPKRSIRCAVITSEASLFVLDDLTGEFLPIVDPSQLHL